MEFYDLEKLWKQACFYKKSWKIHFFKSSVNDHLVVLERNCFASEIGSKMRSAKYGITAVTVLLVRHIIVCIFESCMEVHFSCLEFHFLVWSPKLARKHCKFCSLKKSLKVIFNFGVCAEAMLSMSLLFIGLGWNLSFCEGYWFNPCLDPCALLDHWGPVH